jgi:steroid delta-isomerase-like uncharacterized protein
MATERPTVLEAQAPSAGLADFFQRWAEAWNSQDAEKVLSLMTEDIVYDDSGWPETLRGHDEVRRFLEYIWRAFPDLEFEVIEGPLVAQGEMKAADYWRGRGTMLGPVDPPGFAPTGARVEFEGAGFYEFRDGRISRLRFVFDMMRAGQQIGAVPETGSRAERVGVLLQKLAARHARRKAAR